MSRSRRPRAFILRLLSLSILVVAAPGVVFAQSASVELPQNPRTKVY